MKILQFLANHSLCLGSSERWRTVVVYHKIRCLLLNHLVSDDDLGWLIKVILAIFKLSITKICKYAAHDV